MSARAVQGQNDLGTESGTMNSSQFVEGVMPGVTAIV
eukprot:CAMPEP_0174352882 /NCGR_PEP_ID=MMETSP0811_2-20130205/12669_1 /TAXON_ID=73025 ORGANISM="Eutreptiella gymnastica-like, Strain CCMP1594" /NCGR_SAMPLE_ID=MMETSP0811_2 /ASSEMBLY_ACC=CAM_ASM_000667 /LENGTH=36 /DNA_ID= /DNA_START= /DNA_END= /DNA_ORIENTATION=